VGRALTLLGALVVLAAGLLTPAPAVAQQPVPPPAPTPTPAPPAPTPVPTPTPAPPAAVERMSVTAERVGGRRATVLTGDRFRVRVVVAPYVAGERVVVRVYRNGAKLLARSRVLQPSRTGASGQALVQVASAAAGRLRIIAEHPASPAQVAASAPRAVGLSVLPRSLVAGARGRGVRMVQDRLRALGYVIGERSVFDARTQRAILALRKNLGLPRTTSADPTVLRPLLRGEGRFPVRFPGHGRHVEADLSKQVIALIGAGGRVERIYPTSSGKPSTPTVLGQFRVYLRTPGVNAIGMIHSSYFHRGYAIHGYVSVPVYPASHGCLRVPIPNAYQIDAQISLGMKIMVYV
jgi:hypothetical protein